MRTRYMGEKIIDFGESIYISCEVRPLCEEDLPFEITSANYELICSTGNWTEASGECDISDHELKTFISPEKKGIYTMKFTYVIAEETWVDNFRIRVV